MQQRWVLLGWLRWFVSRRLGDRVGDGSRKGLSDDHDTTKAYPCHLLLEMFYSGCGQKMSGFFL